MFRQRKDMEDRRPKEMVCCAFEEAGCHVNAIHNELDHHMKDSLSLNTCV